MIEESGDKLGGNAKTGKFPTFALSRIAQNTRELACRRTEAEARAIIGGRMLMARELNGYTQTNAAKRLGYATPSQLSQWEMARRTPPIKMLMRACSVYRVSMDYLMGISDEPDRDPATVVRHQVMSAAEEMLATMAHEIADAMLQQTKIGGPAIETAMLMLDEGAAMVKSFRRFVELNKTAFSEDMRGSSALLAAADAFEFNGLASAQRYIERFSQINKDSLSKATKRARSGSANDDLFAAAP